MPNLVCAVPSPRQKQKTARQDQIFNPRLLYKSEAVTKIQIKHNASLGSLRPQKSSLHWLIHASDEKSGGRLAAKDLSCAKQNYIYVSDADDIANVFASLKRMTEVKLRAAGKVSDLRASGNKMEVMYL